MSFLFPSLTSLVTRLFALDREGPGNEITAYHISMDCRLEKKESKMADFEVALSTEATGDNFCVSLWDINSGMQLKAYKGGSCPCRCVCLLGNDYVLASQANKPIIHVWNMAKVH